MSESTASSSFTLFIDGDCPLCRQEGRFLKRLDRNRGRLGFVNITAPDFDAARYGRSEEEFMAAVHGLPASGQMVTGMEAFRQAYAAVGLGWLLAPTGWPVLGAVFDRLYGWFARNRLRLTRRSPGASSERAASCRS